MYEINTYLNSKNGKKPSKSPSEPLFVQSYPKVSDYKQPFNITMNNYTAIKSQNRSSSNTNQPRGMMRSVSENLLQNLANATDKIVHPKVDNVNLLARYSVMAVINKESDVKEEEDIKSEYDYLSSTLHMPDLEAKQSWTEKRKIRKSVIVTSSMGLFLNLLITFLYQANQYIVAPTSGKYANELGMSSSLSGAIIGMAPFAAIVSALVLSYWSNFSFRWPLITSLLMLIAGNLLYALAFQCQSVPLIFVGRLLTGLGAPRGVSRRYIADHVSLKDRTVASSQFISAGALGIAFGPLIASLLSFPMTFFSLYVSLNPESKPVPFIVFNDITAPGWVMALCYIICLVLFLLYFQEPLDSSTHLPHGNDHYKSKYGSNNSRWSQYKSSRTPMPMPSYLSWLCTNMYYALGSCALGGWKSIWNCFIRSFCCVCFCICTTSSSSASASASALERKYTYSLDYDYSPLEGDDNDLYSPAHSDRDHQQFLYQYARRNDHYGSSGGGVGNSSGGGYDSLSACDEDASSTFPKEHQIIVGIETNDDNYRDDDLHRESELLVPSLTSSAATTAREEEANKHSDDMEYQQMNISGKHHAADDVSNQRNGSTSTFSSVNNNNDTPVVAAAPSHSLAASLSSLIPSFLTSKSNHSSHSGHSSSSSPLTVRPSSSSAPVVTSAAVNNRTSTSSPSVSPTSSSINSNGNNSMGSSSTAAAAKKPLEISVPKFDDSVGIYKSPPRAVTGDEVNNFSPTHETYLNDTSTLGSDNPVNAPSTIDQDLFMHKMLNSRSGSSFDQLSKTPAGSSAPKSLILAKSSVRGLKATRHAIVNDTSKQSSGSSATSSSSTAGATAAGKVTPPLEIETILKSYGYEAAVDAATADDELVLSIASGRTLTPTSVDHDSSTQRAFADPSDNHNINGSIQSNKYSFETEGSNHEENAQAKLSGDKPPHNKKIRTTIASVSPNTKTPLKAWLSQFSTNRQATTDSSKSIDIDVSEMSPRGNHHSHPGIAAPVAVTGVTASNTAYNSYIYQPPSSASSPMFYVSPADSSASMMRGGRGQQQQSNELDNTHEQLYQDRGSYVMPLKTLSGDEEDVHNGAPAAAAPTQATVPASLAAKQSSHVSMLSLLDYENEYGTQNQYYNRSSSHHSHHHHSCFWNHISIEVVVILFIYFINKVGQEIVVSAVPTLCQSAFGWNSQMEGLLMSGMGAVVLPSAVLVGRLADGMTDKALVQYLSWMSLFSIVILLNTKIFPYHASQYVVGNVLLFSFLSTLEGVIMALLSKLISAELATGTFNSGLLATEAGTIGRVVGDMTITILGEALIGRGTGTGVSDTNSSSGKASSAAEFTVHFFHDFINALYMPVFVGILLSIALVSVYAHKFEAKDEMEEN